MRTAELYNMLIRMRVWVQVFIPGLAPNAFMLNKLSRSVDEAKRLAADYVLSQLGGGGPAPLGALQPPVEGLH